MLEALFIVVFLGLIVGLAALILFLADKFTLRQGDVCGRAKSRNRVSHWSLAAGLRVLFLHHGCHRHTR